MFGGKAPNTIKIVDFVGFMVVLDRLDLYRVSLSGERYWKMLRRVKRFL